MDLAEECEATSCAVSPPAAEKLPASPALCHRVHMFDVVALHNDRASQEVASLGWWRVELAVGGPGAALGEVAEALRWLAFAASRGRVLLEEHRAPTSEGRAPVQPAAATGMFEAACLRETRRASECRALARPQLQAGRSFVVVQPWGLTGVAPAPGGGCRVWRRVGRCGGPRAVRLRPRGSRGGRRRREATLGGPTS